MIPPLRPNSFKSNVNRYDTETSNETLPIPSLNDTTMMPAPSNKSTRKRGKRELNNLDQSTIISTKRQRTTTRSGKKV